MKCPACQSNDLKVIDSRASEDGFQIRRRRSCNQCDFRFTTQERIEQSLPRVVKQNKDRQTFSERKVRQGLERALEKRPVSAQSLNEIVEQVKLELIALNELEVPSSKIGELLMEGLRKVDSVAYVRFASVYRSFQSVEDFEQALQDLSKNSRLDVHRASD